VINRWEKRSTLLAGNCRAICQYLKSQSAPWHMPIILLSAHQDMQHMVREVGADDFLAKPFAMDDLLALAAKYLGNE
jgi:DNA-binding response OmpR family regulator